MTSRELVIRTLNHDPVERAPRDLWPSPAVEMARADELAEVQVRFPSDLATPDFKHSVGKRSHGKPYREGQYSDAWGCTWHVSERGTAGMLRDPPLADVANLAGYEPPMELLDATRFEKLNRACATTPRFVLARSDIRPFERLQFLHGPEATLVDLARGSADIGRLLAMVHEFYCREAELWAHSEVDGVALRDTWGSADSLLVPCDLWREVFLPLYRDYCQILREHDKFVFFQSDGCIADIFGDLVKAGVDAIHAPWAAQGLERLAQRFRGRVTFWGGIDNPQALAAGGEAVRQSVERVRTALDFSAGGVIAQCPWEAGTPLRSIATVFEAWAQPLSMHSLGAREAG